MTRIAFALISTLVVLPLQQAVVFAQAPLPAASAPSYSLAELDRIVSPIALYPDPLLAQVLAAATFPADIPEAARWADDHHYLTGSELAAAIDEDRLQFDPSVEALIPFPSVLEMMASDMAWTEELGNAFLAQRAEVMDAVQRMRQKAQTYGYLRSNAQVTVSNGPYIEVTPIHDDFIVVPYYDPLVVFAPPRPGVFVAGAIDFRFGVRLGVAFAPWGWGATRFAWPTHAVIINRVPWERTWVNRGTYVHPYAVRRFTGPRPPERHRLVPRTERDRAVEHARSRTHHQR